MTEKPNESELLELRKAKLDELRSSGNAFPNKFKRDSLANDLHSSYGELENEDRIGIVICDHQARDLLSCVDIAMILSNCKIIAQGTPKELINNPVAQNAYFGEAFKIN